MFPASLQVMMVAETFNVLVLALQDMDQRNPGQSSGYLRTKQPIHSHVTRQRRKGYVKTCVLRSGIRD